jgi:hypothetical protein
MAKSIDKSLAEAHARSAANTARQYPDHTRMQQIAKDLAQKAKQTK